MKSCGYNFGLALNNTKKSEDDEIIYSVINNSFSSGSNSSISRCNSHILDESNINNNIVESIKNDIVEYTNELTDVVVSTYFNKNVPIKVKKQYNSNNIKLESLFENTFIKIIDVQQYNLNENVIYPMSYLLSLDSIVTDPNEANYGHDIIFSVYNYLMFIKSYGIKFMYKHLIVLSNVKDLDNAYWNGNYLTFGGGTNSHTPLVSTAIVGHELTHAVIQGINDLEYRGQSGALNESYADILGVMFEFYIGEKFHSLGWELGTECNFLLRNMQFPHKCSQPEICYDTFYVNPNSLLDHGGVHINSGIINHVFYLTYQLIGKQAIILFIDILYELLRNSTFHIFKKLYIRHITKKYNNNNRYYEENHLYELINIINSHIF